MVEAAEKYREYLHKNKLGNFQIEELRDDQDSVIFRSVVSVHGQYIPLAVIFDNTIYTMIRANLASKALNDENGYEVSNYIMRLNHANKLLKYYMAPDTSVLLDACIPSLPGEFSPELVQTLLSVFVKEIELHYTELMKLIWNK